MYWLCYDDSPSSAAIIYAAEAPDQYAHEYGYDSEQEAEQALAEAQEDA